MSKQTNSFSYMRSFMAKYGQRMTEEELVKEAKTLYEKRINEENALLEKFKNNELTNKDQIRRARAIIKARQERANKTKEEN